MRKRLIGAFAVLMALGLMVPAVLAATVVIENNVGDDWHENTADGGTVAFSDEFGAPAGFGEGALKLETGDTNPSRAQLNSDQDAGMLLSTVDDVGYHTYVSGDSDGSDLHAPMINIQIFAEGDTGFTTLVFEPIYTHGNDAIDRGEWQEWDAGGEALWWSTRTIPGVCGINEPAANCEDPYFAEFEDIKDANLEASIILYAMNLGTGNPDITSAVDGFTIGDKTFDFEPLVEPADPEAKNECKDGGWADHGFRNQGLCIQFVNTGKDSR